MIRSASLSNIVCKKVLYFSTFSSALVSLLLLTSAPVHSQTVETVKIGFSSPLTGPQASAGRDNQGGVQLAMERLNAQGVTIGGKKIRFELLAEDDQADPRAGVAVAQKLVDQGVKAVIGPYNSGVTIPASRVFQNAGIVTATVSSNWKVSQQGFDTLYRIAASDVQMGGRMALYAARELKLKQIAVIDDRTAYGQGLADEFSRVAKANGVTIVAREYTTDRASDFNAILTSIKSRKADAVFIGGYAPQGGPLRRQMKQLSLDVPLMGGDGICSPEMGRLGGDSVDDKVYCVQGGALLDKLAEGKRFAADYQRRFNRPPETYAASFYDGMMLVAKAMQTAGSTDPKQWNAALATLHYKGVAGAYEFDDKHDLKQSPVTIYRFRDGAPAPIASY